MAKGKRGRDKKPRKSRKKYLSAGDDTTDISSFMQRTNNNDGADDNSVGTNNSDDSDADNDSSSSENSSDSSDDDDGLQTYPDLTLRLKKDDIRINDKVDFVPRSSCKGAVSTLATRAATGVIVDLNKCASGVGILPERYVVGKTTAVIELEKIHSPSFKVPKYTVQATGEQATLEDIGLKCIVVPLSMLRKHSTSDLIRATPQDVSWGMNTRQRITQPANTPGTDPVAIMPLPPSTETNDDDDVEMEELDFYGGGDILDVLTTKDIESLRAANVRSLQAQADGGWNKLNHPKLPACPAPNEIDGNFSLKSCSF